MALAGSVGVFDFDDEFRLNPRRVHYLRGVFGVDDQTSHRPVAGDFIQRLHQARALALGKPGPDPADIVQLVVHPFGQQQRAKTAARLAGRKPDDLEVARGGGFDLQPRLGLARHVGRIGTFRDDPLQPQVCGLGEKVGPATVVMVAEMDRTIIGDGVLKKPFQGLLAGA